MQSSNNFPHQPSAQSLGKLGSFLDLSQTMINPNFSQQNLNFTQNSASKPQNGFQMQPQRDTSPEQKQIQIDELLKQINIQSLQLSKKRSLEDLTLMDLLNGFDVVVAEKKPRTDLANHVYRLILRQEREKQYSSIQDLSTEIKALKQYERDQEEVKTTFKEIDQNILNTTQFDFQGSFGEEDRNRLFNLGNKENIKHQMKQKLNFPKISLDNVLEMQKIESFQNRCNKLSMIERGNQAKHNFRPNESVQQRTATPNFLNQDLDMVSSMRSPIKNQFHRDQNPLKLQLPKLNLSGLIRQSPQTGNKRSQSMMNSKDFLGYPIQNSNQYYNFNDSHQKQPYNERAIDSDRAIAFAYYTRRLLLNGWRAIYNNHLDKSNSRVLDQIATQKYKKNSKRRIFRALYLQAKQHYGHGTQNKRGLALFQLRAATRYIRKWRQEANDQIIERQKLEIVQEHLQNIKKNNVFNKLKNAVMKLQMRGVQNQTAEHIYRQRYLRKVLLGLRYLIAFRSELREQFSKSKTHNRQRVLRRGLNLFKVQYKKLNHCAQNYYRLGLQKPALELLKKYSLLMKGMNKQKFYIDTYHQKKQKFNLFQFLLASNMIFIEEEENIITMKKRLRLRRYFQALQQNRKNNRVFRVPNSETFYYSCYIWLQLSFDKLVESSDKNQNLDYNQFMNKSAVSYYYKLGKSSKQKLKSYYLSRVIKVWKENTRKVTSFIWRRENTLKFKLMRFLRIKSRQNAKYKYLLKRNLHQKKEKLIKSVWLGIQKYQRGKVFERMIVQKMRDVKKTKKVEQTFVGMKLFAKRKIFRKNQKLLANELHTQNQVGKPYKIWRNHFLKLKKRAQMKQSYLQFIRRRLLKKYLGKIHGEFQKISLKYQRILNYQKTQRKKIIKKALCGFLQNILVNHEKRNKIQIALSYLKHNLLIKSVKVWQYIMPELRQKNGLYKLVKGDQRTKIIQRVFGAIKMYKNFKHNKQTVDYIMTKNIKLITQKRFLKTWRSCQNRKIALQLLEHTFDIHRKQEFLSRVAKKIVYENQVNAHMRIFRLFKLLEFTFTRGLKRNVDRRYEWLEIWDKVQVNQTKLGKLHFLRKWRRDYQQRQKGYKMAWFTLIQIKNQIMKKYFKVLKDKMTLNKLKRVIIADKNTKLRLSCFQELKKSTKSRSNCQKQYTKITKQKRTQTLNFILISWINEIGELAFLRNLTIQKIKNLKSFVLKSWRQKVERNKMNRLKILSGFQISNYHKARLYLRLLYENKENCYELRQKINQLQVLQSTNLLKSYLKGIRNHIQANRDKIKKMQLIRRKVQTRNLRQNFNKWIRVFEPSLIKLRVLKCLGVLNRNIELRHYMQRWLDYVDQSQIIDQIGEKQYQIKLMQQKQDALRLLQQFKERRVIQRDRTLTINNYWVKKTQLKFLTMLRFSVKLISRRRDNKLRAYEFARSQLMRKGLISFAFQSQKHAQFRQITQQFNNTLRVMKAPILLNNLRSFTYKQKEFKIKNQFAVAFMSNRLLQISFKNLLMNYLFNREKRNRQNRGLLFRCENLMRNAFTSLKNKSIQKKMMQEKRYLLTQSIMRLDQNQTLGAAFQNMKYFQEIQRERFLEARGSIVLNQLARLFNVLKQKSQNRKVLKSYCKQINSIQRKRQIRQIMHKWMRALGNEAKIKVMERNRSINLKLSAFSELKRKYSIQRFQFLNLNRKAQNYLVMGLIALKSHSIKQKNMRNAQSHILYQSIYRVLARSFMGLRYQTLVNKNQRVLEVKKNRMLAIKSFSGWKYHIILDKTYRHYTTLKYKQSLSNHFINWFNLFKYKTTQRDLLGTLIVKKDKTEKREFFTLWKKQAYLQKFIDLLQVNFTFPHQRYIAGRCVENWKRFAKMNSQKQELVQQCQEISSSLLARRVLREWLSAASPKLPARVLGLRLQSSVNRLLKIKALYLISVQGYRNEYIEENLTELTLRKGQDVKREYFNEWRKQFAIINLSKIVQIKNRRTLLKNCLLALRLNSQQEKIEKQQYTSLNEFIRVTSPKTQICLMRTFRELGDQRSRLSQNELKRQYFMRFKIATQNQRKVNDLKNKSQQYFRYKTYTKYFYQMLQTFYMTHENRAYDEQGHNFWRQQLSKKVIWAFVENTLKQRKYHHANAFYESKILQVSFNAVKYNLLFTKKKSQLNTRMMYFLKKKCIHIFKLSFTQWRVRFEHKHYGKTAVSEYNNFRNTKLKRMAFDYLVAIIQQRQQIGDMVSKAQQYFQKKEYLRTAHKCFYALRDYSLTHKHKNERNEGRDMTSLKFYAFNLMTSHLRAWKKEVRMNRNRQKRSKMYSVFSAWKFYTKERVLLKKYLQECNQTMGVAPIQDENAMSAMNGYLSGRSGASQSQYLTKKARINHRIDPNMMSTQEMRENVARFSNLKSDFIDGMSQEGTPFVTSMDRKILSSNKNILNSASPNTRVGGSAQQYNMNSGTTGGGYSGAFGMNNNRISVGSAVNNQNIQNSQNTNNNNSGSNYNSANQSYSKTPLQQQNQRQGAYSRGRQVNRKYM